MKGAGKDQERRKDAHRRKLAVVLAAQFSGLGEGKAADFPNTEGMK